MRITIDTDDKGKVNIDTGDNDKPGLFQSTADIPVIDAGPAPIQEIERRQKGVTATEVSSPSASASPEYREGEEPLNPLRAGAAAAYKRPDNLRKKAAGLEGTSVAQAPTSQDPSVVTFDGGAAQVPRDKKSSDAPTPEPQ